MLYRNPDLVPQAVEELLRFIPLGSGGGFPRLATEDIEVGGVTVREGEAVFVYTPSGNRDASVFDDPETLDVTRADNPHMAFGHGVHHCLGAPLARMEMRTAFPALFRRFPALRAVDDDVRFRSFHVVYGLTELQVAW